jgi:hypothetical protein
MPSEIPVWVELAKALPSVATAIAAIYGASIAKAGLNKWRAETIGKRRAELAEAVLADFYRFEDVMRAVRSPVPLDYGTPELQAELQKLPAKTLSENREFLSQMRVRRHAFAALFGKQAASPFDEAHKLVELIDATHETMWIYLEIGSSEDPSKRALFQSWEDVIFSRPENTTDAVAQRIRRAVDAIEQTCRPEIEARTLSS